MTLPHRTTFRAVITDGIADSIEGEDFGNLDPVTIVRMVAVLARSRGPANDPSTWNVTLTKRGITAVWLLTVNHPYGEIEIVPISNQKGTQ